MIELAEDEPYRTWDRSQAIQSLKQELSHIGLEAKIKPFMKWMVFDNELT